MNAKEAKELALWNRIPEFIRKQIEACVDNGGRYMMIYDVEFYNFKSEADSTEVLLLELGYKVINNQNNNTFEIFW